MARVFVCPSCGTIDKGDGILQECWKEIGRYTYNPETMECKEEDREVIEYLYITCNNCGEYIEEQEAGCEPIYTLLVDIVEETDSTIKVAPVGSYWLKNPQKLADVLATSTGKVVEIVAPENAE